MEHVLSTCKTALTQGRYRLRHDKVLRQLADTLERERTKKRKAQLPHGISFIKAGQSAPKQSQVKKSILDESDEWFMAVDLNKKLVFPDIHTTLRPDIVIWSRNHKRLLIIELTVPWETRCEEAHERKRDKYAELQRECTTQGWRTWLFPVEVGARGFAAQSMWTLLGALGIGGRERKRAVQSICQAAETGSSWLWLKRDENGWKPTADT